MRMKCSHWIGHQMVHVLHPAAKIKSLNCESNIALKWNSFIDAWLSFCISDGHINQPWCTFDFDFRNIGLFVTFTLKRNKRNNFFSEYLFLFNMFICFIWSTIQYYNNNICFYWKKWMSTAIIVVTVRVKPSSFLTLSYDNLPLTWTRFPFSRYFNTDWRRLAL